MRRRHLVITGAAILAMAFLGWRWQNSPRIDPRLVGKWECFHWKFDGPEHSLMLREDGSCYELLMWSDQPSSYFQTWHVEDGVLILDSRDVLNLDRRWWLWGRRLWYWARHPQRWRASQLYRYSQSRYEILKISEDSLWLRRLGEPAGSAPNRPESYSRAHQSAALDGYVKKL